MNVDYAPCITLHPFQRSHHSHTASHWPTWLVTSSVVYPKVKQNIDKVTIKESGRMHINNDAAKFKIVHLD